LPENGNFLDIIPKKAVSAIREGNHFNQSLAGEAGAAISLCRVRHDFLPELLAAGPI